MNYMVPEKQVEFFDRLLTGVGKLPGVRYRRPSPVRLR